MGGDRHFRWVLAAYPADCHSSQARALGSAGGFSGAQIWRIEAPRGSLCLRRWPGEHPSRERLQFIHDVLKHVRQQGLTTVPVPISTREGATFVREAGKLWELAPWMPGESDYLARRSLGKLTAALAALAEFHVAAETFPRLDGGRTPSPGIATRLSRLESFTPERLGRLSRAVGAQEWPELADRATLLLEQFPRHADSVRGLLRGAAEATVCLQPCIRDIWHGHVLYQGDLVTGLVDFGAMQYETVAGDAARLLGSMVDEQGRGWREGLAAYEAVRPLAPAERGLLDAYDRSGVLLSGMNWLVWILEEGRHFENKAGVLERIDQNLGRLLHSDSSVAGTIAKDRA